MTMLKPDQKTLKVWMPKKLQDLLFSFDDDIIFKVAYGGRYGAKTRSFEAAAVKYVLENRGSTFLCVRGNQTSIQNSLLAGIKKTIFRLGVEKQFEIGEKYIKTKPDKDGVISRFIFMGAQAYENFRSLEDVNIAWIDEGHVISEDAWDTIIPSIRGNNSEIWITFNARRKFDWVYKHFIVEGDPLARVVKINYDENIMLPERERLKAESMKQQNYRKYRHIYLGELDDQPEDALWKEELFLYKKDIYLEDLEKIVVAIDPAGDESTKNSDESGLVVAGKLGKKGYILEDSSKNLSYLQQAKKAVELYNRYKADYIVVEKNGVGEGMKTTIKLIDDTIQVKTVSARRGKYLRAEPISALYEDGRIYHKQVFSELQYEMTSYTGDPKEKSPNRLDAAVYALTEMFKNNTPDIADGWGIPEEVFS